MKSKPKIFDFFCGCGGLSLGLEQAGFDIRWAMDNWSPAVSTYRDSHPFTTFFEEDAQLLFSRLCSKDKDLPSPGDVDLIVGGPPCQGFSGYNRYRSPDDPRNSMIELFTDFVALLKPSFVLIENVPGMLSIGKGSVVEFLKNKFKELKYNIRLRIIQAGNYGLPQNRWRVFVIAAKEKLKLPLFPEPTHLFPRTVVFGAKNFRDCILVAPKGKNLFWDPSPQVTVGDAISDLPEIKNGSNESPLSYLSRPKSEYQRILRDGEKKVYDHVCKNLGPIMLERVQAVPKKPGAGWLDLPEHLKPRNLAKHGDKRYDNRFGRLYWDGTFNTILRETLMSV